MVGWINDQMNEWVSEWMNKWIMNESDCYINEKMP